MDRELSGFAPVTTRRTGQVGVESAADWASHQYTGSRGSDALLRALAASAAAVLGGPPWYWTGDVGDLTQASALPAESLDVLLDHLNDLGAIRWQQWDVETVHIELGRYAAAGDLAPYFPPPHPPVPDATRTLVMDRDGHRCTACGSTENPTIDHIEPQVYGGGHDPSNLRVLCRSCNSTRGCRA